MKNYLTLLTIVLLTFTMCTNPEKASNNADRYDSLATLSDSDSTILIISPDTVTIDSVKQSSIFNKADSQSYFILSNYFTSVTENQVKGDMQIIDSTCAVLVYPTDAPLSGVKQEYPADFATIADDNL